MKKGEKFLDFFRSKKSKDARALKRKHLLFLDSCSDGDLKQVEHIFIDLTCDINYQSPTTGDTPLLCALKNQHFDVVKFLVENKADGSIRNHAGQFVLHLAIELKSADIFKILCQYVDVNEVDSNGNSALHLLCESEDPERLEMLTWLTRCGKLKFQVNSNQESILHSVCKASDEQGLETWRLLLREIGGETLGNICNIRNSQGNTTLHVACARGKRGLLRSLLQLRDADWKVTDAQGFNVVHRACSAGDLELMHILFTNFPNCFKRLSVPRSPGGKGLTGFECMNRALHPQEVISLFFGAVRGNYGNVVRFFMKGKKEKFKVAVQSSGCKKTALHVSCELGLSEMIKGCIQWGVSTDAQDAMGNTALHVACKKGRVGDIEMLLRYHANTKILNAKNELALKHVLVRQLHGKIDALAETGSSEAEGQGDEAGGGGEGEEDEKKKSDSGERIPAAVLWTEVLEEKYRRNMDVIKTYLGRIENVIGREKLAFEKFVKNYPCRKEIPRKSFEIHVALMLKTLFPLAENVAIRNYLENEIFRKDTIRKRERLKVCCTMAEKLSAERKVNEKSVIDIDAQLDKLMNENVFQMTDLEKLLLEMRSCVDGEIGKIKMKNQVDNVENNLQAFIAKQRAYTKKCEIVQSVIKRVRADEETQCARKNKLLLKIGELRKLEQSAMKEIVYLERSLKQNDRIQESVNGDKFSREIRSHFFHLRTMFCTLHDKIVLTVKFDGCVAHHMSLYQKLFSLRCDFVNARRVLEKAQRVKEVSIAKLKKLFESIMDAKKRGFYYLNQQIYDSFRVFHRRSFVEIFKTVMNLKKIVFAKRNSNAKKKVQLPPEYDEELNKKMIRILLVFPGNENIIEKLLIGGVELILEGPIDSFGNTSLHYACYFERLNYAQLLLYYDVSLHPRNKGGKTAKMLLSNRTSKRGIRSIKVPQLPGVKKKSAVAGEGEARTPFDDLFFLYENDLFKGVLKMKQLLKVCDLIKIPYEKKNRNHLIKQIKKNALGLRAEINKIIKSRKLRISIKRQKRLNSFFTAMAETKFVQEYLKVYKVKLVEGMRTSKKNKVILLRLMFTFPNNLEMIKQLLRARVISCNEKIDVHENSLIHYSCFFENNEYIRILLLTTKRKEGENTSSDILKISVKNKFNLYPFSMLDVKNDYFYRVNLDYVFEGFIDQKTQLYSGMGKLFMRTQASMVIGNAWRKKMVYFGEWKRGKKNGKGREFSPKTGQILYYGKFKNGLRHGRGIEYGEKMKNGQEVILRRGEWENGKFKRDDSAIHNDVPEVDLSEFHKTVLMDKSLRTKHFISAGSYGEIYRYKDKYALKYFNAFLKNEQAEKIRHEINMLSRLMHPNVIKIVGYSLKEPVIAIITELCDTSVAEFMRSSDGETPVFEWGEKLRILYEVSMGMEFLHFNHVIHRDLKWDNVLLTYKKDVPMGLSPSSPGSPKSPGGGGVEQNGGMDGRQVKIIDFGFAKIHDSFRFSTKHSFLGSFDYIAPEVADGLYDYKVDVFAFGILLYELLMETDDPFNRGQNTFNSKYWGINITHEVRKGLRPDITKIDPKVRREKSWYVGLMKRCWDHSPDMRPSFSEILCEILKYKESEKELEVIKHTIPEGGNDK